MSIFGYSEGESDGYDSREPNETEKELSSCCDAEMIDGVCSECLRTTLDYRYEQKVKEFNKYMGDFNNRLKRIKTIK